MRRCAWSRGPAAARLSLARRSRAAVVGLAGAFLAVAVGCSTVPEIDGVPATRLTTDEVVAAGRAARAEGDPARAAELLEFVIQHDYRREDLSEIRFEAATCWFEAGRYDDAYEHDRRLMLEDPFTARGPQVAERAWTMGSTLVRSRRRLGDDRELGQEILNFLVTRFSRSSHADDAWKELALLATEDGQHQAAIDIYERLLRDHPESEWTDLALYEAARSYGRLTSGRSYDADPLLLSHAAYGRYLRLYPDGNFAADARRERRALEQRISVRELELAGYYRARGAPEGERLHLANAATRFPDTPAAAKAREILAELDLDVAGNSADLIRPREDAPIWRRQAAGRAAADAAGG